MGAVQGKRTVFSTHLYIGGQQWPTQSQPRHFQSGAQRRLCCLHPSGAPTHLHLSCPFCWSRTNLWRSLQEVMSQDEIFMSDISGYIRERVKHVHIDRCSWYHQIILVAPVTIILSCLNILSDWVLSGSIQNTCLCVHVMQDQTKLICWCTDLLAMFWWNWKYNWLLSGWSPRTWWTNSPGSHTELLCSMY